MNQIYPLIRTVYMKHCRRVIKRVRLGVLRRSTPSHPEDIYQASIHKLHEEFTIHKIPHPNDIACIELDRKVEFSNRIHPICLPKKNSDFLGQEAEVAGWGHVNRTSGHSDILKKANVRIMKMIYECEEEVGNQVEITSRMLCAKSRNFSGNACQV